MVVISGRDFRANQSKYIKIAHTGEDVVISSRAGNVRLTPVSPNDIIINRSEITPELMAKIEKARKEFREGQTLHFENAAAAQQWMDEL